MLALFALLPYHLIFCICFQCDTFLAAVICNRRPVFRDGVHYCKPEVIGYDI